MSPKSVLCSCFSYAILPRQPDIYLLLLFLPSNFLDVTKFSYFSFRILLKKNINRLQLHNFFLNYCIFICGCNICITRFSKQLCVKQAVIPFLAVALIPLKNPHKQSAPKSTMFSLSHTQLLDNRSLKSIAIQTLLTHL